MITGEAVLNVKIGETSDWLTLAELYEKTMSNTNETISVRTPMGLWQPISEVVRRSVDNNDKFIKLTFSDGNTITGTNDTFVMLWNSQNDPYPYALNKVRTGLRSYANGKLVSNIRQVGYLGYVYDIKFVSYCDHGVICNSIAVL